MTNEEIQRTMEFILAGQARFDARMEKDEDRIAQLEAAFVTLVELARITDERQDRMDQRVDRFEDRLEAMMPLTDAKLAELAQRLDALIHIVELYISKGNNDAPQV